MLQVSFISPQEAVFAQERGVPIIDVRPAVDHYCSRIPGSIGIPFMRSITGMLTFSCIVAVTHFMLYVLYAIHAVCRFWYVWRLKRKCDMTPGVHSNLVLQSYSWLVKPCPCLQATQYGRILDVQVLLSLVFSMVQNSIHIFLKRSRRP